MKLNLLSGKRALFIGSSVTYGSGAGGISFVDMLVEDGLTVIKEAMSGTTLCDIDNMSYVSRLKKFHKDTVPDFVVCQLSTNDASRGLPYGSVSTGYELSDFDTTTVAGAIEYIIAYVKEQWNVPVVFYTGTNYKSQQYEKMVSLLLCIAEKWKLPVIDMWNDKDLNSISEELKHKFIPDGIHPTYEGYKTWWTPYIRRVLIELVERKII